MSMIDGLPSYYRKSQVVKDLYNAIQSGLEKFEGDMDTKASNLFVLTASDLSLHEKDVGLISDPSFHEETRRAQVLARLQGCKLLTIKELKSIVTLFEKTGCNIKEDFENYAVTICFDKCGGAPRNFKQLKAAIDELKPAHLNFQYDFSTDVETNIYTGVKVVGIKRTLPKVEAAEIPRESEVLSGVAIGIKVTGIKRTLPKAEAMQYNTYEDIKQYSNDEIKDKTYLELLYKQED